MATKKTKFNANSWEFTQRIIRIGHNRRVKKYFKDIASNTATSTGRQAIKTSLLIRDNDSGIETLNKMTYFANYLDRDLSATYPESWRVQVGHDIPQLAVVYRNLNPKSKSGDYPIHIPHYNGNRNPKIKPYYKGNYWARWTLKDNSKIIVNAKTEAEALKVIRQLEKYVERKYKTKETPGLVTGEVSKGTYDEFLAVPIRADYYPTGKKNGSYPQWRKYF